ncbi:MAG: protein-L-isoaspartate O-methyltransferase [Pseudomonadota bacterium]
MNIEQARFNMIEQQIRPWDVLDPAVLSLLALVRREDFVPPALTAMAFMDTEVPLPVQGGEREFMLAPKLEARLLQELAVHKHERVLEIGTGSGFMAALLAHKAQHVTTFELRPELVKFASDNLRRAGVANVTVIQGDGAAGQPSEAPWDVIVLSGSVSQVPESLLRQLKPGGRLIAVVGEEPIMQATLFTRTDDQSFQRTVLFDTMAPRLHGFEKPSVFQF